MQQARRAGLAIGAGVLAMATISACVSRGEPHPASMTVTTTVVSTATKTVTATVSARPTQPSTAPSSTPAAPVTHLYQQFEAEHSVGPNGQAVEATLAGVTFPYSTGMWVGCSGEPATTTYRLGRQFVRLTAAAGLQPHTPEKLTVKVNIIGDGNNLQEFVVGTKDTQPVNLDVTGVDALVVSAIAVDGSLCGSSGTPYGALGTAVLVPVSG